MLLSLYIRNYALISELNIDFSSGLSIITGETGAGKSILLGALSLILGQRADSSILFDKENKCIVEGKFSLDNESVKTFFENNDLDYESVTHIRREITSLGKSRAFINDTPVKLTQLKELGSHLVDIHSQHQNLTLGKYQFQLNILDSLANHSDLLTKYEIEFSELKNLESKLDELKSTAEKEKRDLDYYQYQFNQLEEAALKENELKELEKEIETLNHAEEIKSNLTNASLIMSGDENSNTLANIRQIKQFINQISTYFQKADDLNNRIESVYIELQDIAGEIEILTSDIEHNPARIEVVNQRLDQLYSLLHKHKVSEIIELVTIKDEIEARIDSVMSSDNHIIEIQKQIDLKKSSLVAQADKLSKNRKKTVPLIDKNIVQLLQQLGMPGASFSVRIEKLDSLSLSGIDKVKFLFSANKKVEMAEISKVASGGELSRLMLAVKSIVSGASVIPTIIFDEIDMGVSGDIADKMGNILREMARSIQIISITHLPQIAGKGNAHFVVYKQETNSRTSTNMMLLAKEDRITEIAKMLSGENLTPAALENARELLKN